MKRKKMHNLFDTAQEAWGSFDDFPALPPGSDPMPHISRNTVSQPFYLVSDRDQTLINLVGEGEVWFQGERPERMQVVANDCIYIPAGVPCRIITRTPSLQIRFKAEAPAREAVAWYCDACGELLHWRSIDTSVEIPQAVYWEATQAFNQDEGTRTCPACGAVHERVELGDIAWPQVAAALRPTS